MKKDKKKNNLIILKIFSAIFIIAGLIIFFVPTISNWLYSQNVKQLKYEYITEIEDVNNNKYQELYSELKMRNEYLYTNKQKDLIDPFSYEQSTIDLEKYGLPNNIIGFIDIPKISIEMPIYLGANTENMKKGAVHLTETSYPIGGENTNSVIAAHRGYGKAKMFRNIDKLEIGDEVYIQNFWEKLEYKVYDIKIIMPTDINQLLIKENEDLITLITCHPYRINTQRYVVLCKRAKTVSNVKSKL